MHKSTSLDERVILPSWPSETLAQFFKTEEPKHRSSEVHNFRQTRGKAFFVEKSENIFSMSSGYERYGIERCFSLRAPNSVRFVGNDHSYRSKLSNNLKFLEFDHNFF